MKNQKYIVTAICFLMAASAQAQSWGFTLGNGTGFFYSDRGSRPRVVNFVQPAQIYYPRQVWCDSQRPVVLPRRSCYQPWPERSYVTYRYVSDYYVPPTPRTFYTGYQLQSPDY